MADAPFMFIGVRQQNSFRSEKLRNYVFDPALWTYRDRYWIAGA